MHINKMKQMLHMPAAVMLLVLIFINTAETVPASILAENSEITNNMNKMNNKNKNDMNQMLKQQVSHENNINKVKRSSNNGFEFPTGSADSSFNAVLEKKSSPEVVPALFNSPALSATTTTQSAKEQDLQLQEQLQQQYQQQQRQRQQQQQLESASSLQEAGLSGIKPLTVAAVEAQLQQQQLKQQQQQEPQNYFDDSSSYDDENAPNLMQKRNINTPAYLYALNAGDSAILRGDGYESIIPEYYNYNQNNQNNQNNNNNNNNNNVPYFSPLDTGVLSDMDVNAGNIMYNDFDEYATNARASSYRNKAYDNLQRLLNSETYVKAKPQSAVYMPLQYDNGRYYGGMAEPIDRERNKRKLQNNYNNFADMRLKRDNKLTPADMLALVALVEAGERARKDTETDVSPPVDAANARNYYNTNPYQYAAAPVGEFNYNMGNSAVNGPWLDSGAMADYYSSPVTLDPMPRYNNMRGQMYPMGNDNRLNNKRYMVAKKNRAGMVKPNYNNYAEKKFF